MNRFVLAVMGGVLVGVLPTLAEAEPPYRAVNREVVATKILPGYAALADATAALDSTAESFCEAPDGSGLADMRQGFHDSMDAWMAVQHLRFGPIETLMRGFRLQFWPDKNNALGKQLIKLLSARDAAALEPDRIQRGSAAVQGLPALERLLFDDGAETVLLDASDDQAFRCQLVQAIAGNLAGISEELLRDWRDGEQAFAKAMEDAGPDSAHFLDHREVSAKLLAGAAFTLQAITDQKLARPLGKSRERAKPKRAESWRSERSLRNIALNLDAARQLYEGLAPLLPEGETAATLDRTIRDGFTKAQQDLDAVPSPLARAVVSDEGRTRIDALAATLAMLGTAIKGPFAQATNLTVGFNSLDGD